MGTNETGKEIAETMEPVISDVVYVLNVGDKGRLNLTITNLPPVHHRW